MKTLAQLTLITSTALALVACMPAPDAEPGPERAAPAAQETPPPADMSDAGQPVQRADLPGPDCALDVSAPWVADGVDPLVINAVTSCEDDGRIIVDLRIFDGAGREIFNAGYFPDQVMLLAWYEADGISLEQAIEGWITPDNWRVSTAELPDYNDQAEFPFMPSLTAQEHEAARNAAYPMLCYVQGMESQLCLALVEGEIVEMGVQLFPG